MFVTFELLEEYYEMGGFVMPLLVSITFLLWYGLANRYINLISTKKDPRGMIRNYKQTNKVYKGVVGEAVIIGYEALKKVNTEMQLRSYLDEEYANLKERLDRHRTLIKSIVLVAPLLGLLGTVDGMIETFDSLGDMALFSSTGGIAGGISKALFTTQMGLVISIPGLLIGRMLDRKSLNLQRELDQVKDLICMERA